MAYSNYGATLAGYIVEQVSGMAYETYVNQNILPAWTSVLGLLQGVLIPLTLVTTVFAVVSWVQGYWRLTVRVHYTVFALAALLLMWVFRYWNLV